MGTKANPGDFDCYENAEDDEPMFVLLARDVRAAGTVRHWAYTYELNKSIENSVGNGPEALTERQERKFNEALACATAMEAWRATREDS